MTFYNNHVITIITTAVDIVTVDHCIDHCDYFPCRELYVLVSDFIIRMKPKPFPRARSDSFLEALPHCLTVRSQGERELVLGTSGRQRCKVYSPTLNILSRAALPRMQPWASSIDTSWKLVSDTHS